jgi:hypothetical protein
MEQRKRRLTFGGVKIAPSRLQLENATRKFVRMPKI